MFGDISGMMNQLQQAQQKIEETKKRLDTVLIDEETSGKIKVTVTANREIKSIQVDDSLLEDAEELEDYLVLTLNKALQRANEINEQEMAAAAKTNMPNIPGMDLFK
jgi:DNA-binding YbaB/EbfC family protein